MLLPLRCVYTVQERFVSGDARLWAAAVSKAGWLLVYGGILAACFAVGNPR